MATQDEHPRRTAGRRKTRTSGVGRTGARFPTLPPEPEETGAHSPPAEDADRGTGGGFGSGESAGADSDRGSGGHLRSLSPEPADLRSLPPEVDGHFEDRVGAQSGEYDEQFGGQGGSPDADEQPEPAVGGTGARYGPYSVRKAKRPKRSVDRAPRPAPTPSAASSSLEPVRAVRWPDEAFNELAEEIVKPWSSALVRPYAHTGGRTRADHDLALEALISTSVEADLGPAPATPHGRAIVELCLQPRSVAEVAALLAVPLGVARILLSDLATAGVVFVHPTAGGRAPDVEFMHRVLVGLRRL